MTTHNTLSIRKLICEAKKQDAQSGALLKLAQSKLSSLSHIIQPTQDKPSQALKDFICQYIEHTPVFLDALKGVMLEAEIDEQGGIFIAIAEDFFLNPPELVQDHSGLVALLDEAYLAHRIMEEINDRIAMTCGAPLYPIDMSISNIIVHTILGEEFANQLDLAVHYAIESSFKDKGFICSPKCSSYFAKHRNDDWANLLQKWPSLSGDTNINLDLKKWLL